MMERGFLSTWIPQELPFLFGVLMESTGKCEKGKELMEGECEELIYIQPEWSLNCAIFLQTVTRERRIWRSHFHEKMQLFP